MMPAMIRSVLLLCLLLGVVLPARAQEKPLAVTTDTEEYCEHLSDLVAAHPNPGPEVRRLLTQGRALCERGQVRGGIRRLRRAMVILRHSQKATAKADAQQPATPEAGAEHGAPVQAVGPAAPVAHGR